MENMKTKLALSLIVKIERIKKS